MVKTFNLHSCCVGALFGVETYGGSPAVAILARDWHTRNVRHPRVLRQWAADVLGADVLGAEDVLAKTRAETPGRQKGRDDNRSSARPGMGRRV